MGRESGQRASRTCVKLCKSNLIFKKQALSPLNNKNNNLNFKQKNLKATPSKKLQLQQKKHTAVANSTGCDS